MTAQTIDRIQVEFSTNLDALIGSLAVAERGLDSINDSFARSETASATYVESMGQAGSAASASAEGFATLAAGIDDLAAASAVGAEAASLYAGSMTNTLGAVTTINYQMDLTVDRFNEVNTAATNTATAIGRVNNISNNAYTTFSRLSSNSTTATKAIAKLAAETRTLSTAYSTASTGTDTFTKSLGSVGTTATTVVTQINQYSTAISTAGTESRSAAEEMDKVTQKTGETEGAMGKLSGAASKVFAGFSVGTVLTTLDTVIKRAEEVSQKFQNLESDIGTSLGTLSPELSAEINAVVENLIGTVPASQNTALGTGASLLRKYLDDVGIDVGSSEFEDLMVEYASYADLWNMNLTDLIDATQRLFTKYNITTERQMKEALGMINAVNNLAPAAAPSSVISILNNNRQAIGAQGWDLEEALSRVVNAGNDRAMSKFQEYLNALQTVKATKGMMFDSDEAFAEWIETVTEMVRNAESETQAQNIIMTEYGIRGTSAMEIAKYLRLENSDVDRTDEILAQLEKNGNGLTQYLRQETSAETIARANSVPTQADKTLGDGVLEIKEQIAEQNAYDRKMYDVVSVRLGDLTTYIDKIPVVGEILSPITGIVKDYIPEINIKKGINGTPEEFIDKYEARLERNEYTPFDETYYLAYRKLADQLQVYYDDLKFSGDDAASVRKDLVEGLYTDLILRVKAARSGEEVRSLSEVTADVIAGSGITIDTATFTGTLQLPDGTVLEGADAAAVLDGTQTVAPPEEEPKSFFEKIGEFFSNLFGSAEALETATVSGVFAAVAQGNAEVSAAGDMLVSADQATIVADLAPIADRIVLDPEIDLYPAFTVEVTVPETGRATYHATADPVGMPTPAGTLETPANIAGAEPPEVADVLIEPAVSVVPELAVTPQVAADISIPVSADMVPSPYPAVEMPTPAGTLEPPANIAGAEPPYHTTVMPAPFELPAEAAGAQASVGFAELSMAIASVPHEPEEDGGILQEIRTVLDELKNVVRMLGAAASSPPQLPFVSRGNISITQNISAQTVDSYSIRNAAVMAVRTAEAAAYRL